MSKNIGFRISIHIAFLMSMISSCVEKFDVDLGESEPRLVVNGIISDQPGETYVSLLNTQPYVTGDYYVPPIPVEGATVRVLDTGGDVEFELFDVSGRGKYVGITDEIKGNSGVGYVLEVILKNGETYRSDLVTIPEKVPTLDNVDAELKEYKEYNERISDFSIVYKVDLLVDFSSKERVYLQWDVEGTTEIYSLENPDAPYPESTPICYIRRDPSGEKQFLAKSSAASEKSVRIPAIKNIRYSSDFRWGYGFKVKQYSIEAGAYEYLRKTKLLMESSGSLFDPFPSSITGNIYSIVGEEKRRTLGYFIARKGGAVNYLVTNANKLGKRITTSCEDLIIAREIQKTEGGGGPPIEIPPSCFDCLRFDGATTKRPDYWY
ncbi:hypothetical protein FUAX_52540 (plasmid) [Fulvitalea axinellae]|uniref:DUF4249 domain-containing protein n=1 Tax=Fulvitalea axinellae TaxID=1182444 RepID=A0AAU9CYF9_9BACT|nr:hypothetical protein FUAX_52540 [Fulvitalea axinellae]